MKFAIIAAGEGSRLAQEGVSAPKPLVKVNGEALIDRLIRIFKGNGATEIVVICNNIMPEVKRHLEEIKSGGIDDDVPLTLVVKTTPSSMHSFYEISGRLTDAPFCLTTVDTIFREEEFSRYIEEFKAAVSNGLDGMMGVTDFIDDEKPLYVRTGEDMDITGFPDENDGSCRFISGGIYGLTPKATVTLDKCIKRGESRMRNFQRALIEDNFKLKAWKFSKVLDIDHATDIEKAEKFLRECR